MMLLISAMHDIFAGSIITNLLGLWLVSLIFFEGGCIGYIECYIFCFVPRLSRDGNYLLEKARFHPLVYSFLSCFTAHLVSVIFQLKAK